MDRVEDFIAPRTATEKALADIWMDILGIDQVSVSDDFFAVGGNSLLSIRVFGRIADQFELEMPLSVLFTETTLERLACRALTGKISARANGPCLCLSSQRVRRHPSSVFMV